MRARAAGVVVASMLIALTAGADKGIERVYLSAPILPRVDGAGGLYGHEGVDFPATLDAEAQLAHDAALTYDFLLKECAPVETSIQVQAAEAEPLSQTVLANNFAAVAKCAYERFVSKPYWIPQLVDDVDICKTELGDAWRLVAESDFAHLDAADYQFLKSTLTAPGTEFWGPFYFSLRVYVRGEDGSLKEGNLEPDATWRVRELSATGEALKSHHELDADGIPVSLRCIRRFVVL